MPQVSVLLAVYNGMPYLGEAIDSMLAQRDVDFELLIVDDGSRDGSAELAATYRDPRIRLVYRKQNGGHGAALNDGFALAQGTYVARMDADDWSEADRLRRQRDFLDSHPEVGLCGSAIRLFGQGSTEVVRYPLDDQALRCRLLFESPFAHPSVMFRRTLLQESGLRYDPAYPGTEDYALWASLADHTRFANLAEPLLRYRRHPEQTGQARAATQIASADRVRRSQIRELGIEPTPLELALHSAIGRAQITFDRRLLAEAGRWLLRLQAANEYLERYPTPAFAHHLARRWYFCCRSSTRLGLIAWRLYCRSPLSRYGPARFRLRTQLLVHCVARALR